MNKLSFLFLLGCLALTGCARHYVMTLSNGSQIDAYGKPKLADGRYHFKNGQGKDTDLSAGQVREIAPASMAHEGQTTFNPPKPPKQRHWYFLWLALRHGVGVREPTQSLLAIAATPSVLAGGPHLPIFGLAGVPFPAPGLEPEA